MKRFFASPHIARSMAIAVCILALPAVTLAEAPKKSALDNPMALVLLSVIVVLLLIIGMLGYVLIGGAEFYLKKFRENEKKDTDTITKTVTVLALLLSGSSLFAQETKEVVVASNTISGMDPVTFYVMMSVLGLELVVIFSFAFFLKRLLGKEQEAIADTAQPLVKRNLLKQWWNKANNFRSVKEEADITLDHEYDGIRELDNRLPPWWLYGFYLTIVFSVIYLWRYEVSHSAPSTIQEYTADVQRAEVEKEEYLSKAASKVDENTVVMLDASGIASGKTIFTGSCAPCHGADGGGIVGPNLTDPYWMHGGSMKDIFKTIKYGVQEKGMKAWKDDFSPVQIAQLTSYIKSIQGTKPATPKEAQGELYKEEARADSGKIAQAKP